MHYLDVTFRVQITDYPTLYDMFTSLGYKEHAVELIPPGDVPQIPAIHPEFVTQPVADTAMDGFPNSLVRSERKVRKSGYRGRVTRGKARAIKKYIAEHPDDTLIKVREDLARLGIHAGASTISHIRCGTYDNLIETGKR